MLTEMLTELISGDLILELFLGGKGTFSCSCSQPFSSRAGATDHQFSFSMLNPCGSCSSASQLQAEERSDS